MRHSCTKIAKCINNWSTQRNGGIDFKGPFENEIFNLHTISTVLWENKTHSIQNIILIEVSGSSFILCKEVGVLNLAGKITLCFGNKVCTCTHNFVPKIKGLVLFPLKKKKRKKTRRKNLLNSIIWSINPSEATLSFKTLQWALEWAHQRAIWTSVIFTQLSRFTSPLW